MLFGLDGIELSIIIVFSCLLIGILSGFPVAFALGGSALISLTIILVLNGNGALVTESGEPIIQDSWQSILRNVGLIPNRIFGNILGGPSVDVLLAVPLFVFMGITLERSRIAEDLLTTMAKAFGAMPGGLAISVVVVGALLAASTGIVGATVVTMGLLSLPTMLRHGYSTELATGTICASGTLGQIIPPSIVLVLLGQQVGEIYSEAHPGEVVSVGTLFKAAMIPGLVLVLLYIAYILFVALRDPNKAPAVHEFDAELAKEREKTHRKPIGWVIGLPLAIIALWILLSALGINGPQQAAPGAAGEFAAAPLSSKVTMLCILAGIIMALAWTLFPDENLIPILIGLLGVTGLLFLDILMVHPQTSPGSAFFIYLIPILMAIWGMTISFSRLSRNDILRVVFPPLVLIIAVLGSILGGLTNPTAAAGLGAGGAILLAATRLCGDKYQRWPIVVTAISTVILLLISSSFDLRMQISEISGENQIAIIFASLCYYIFLAGFFYACYILIKEKVMRDVVLQTTKITSMVFVILIGSQMLNLTLKTFGGDSYIQDFLRQFDSEHAVLLLVLVVIFIMGFVLDFLEIIYIVIPIVGPVIFGGDLDPKWVTILIAVNLQTSFLTPPFGFALFYLRGVAPKEVKTTQMYKGILPFVLIQILALVIFWFIEPLSTFLPNLLPEGR